MHLSRKRFTAILLSCVLILSVLTGCGSETPAASEQTTAPTQPARQMRNGVQTILMVSQKEYAPDTSKISYRNPNQSDLMLVLIVDEASNKISSLQLNPDTMISFTPQGTHDPIRMPLSEVLSYGSGGSDSYLNVMKAVSKLLNGVNIDHYMFFTLDAIGIVAKLIGGVEMEIEDEFPAEYEKLTKGTVVTLSGSSCTQFFDYRDAEDYTNESHMRRQQQFIAKSFIPFAQHMQDDNFLTKLTVQLGDGMATDLTLSQMALMMEQIGQRTLDTKIETLPGAVDINGKEYEYNIFPDLAANMVNRLFFN